MHSSLEPNIVDMLICLRILVIQRDMSEKTLVLFTVLNWILSKISHITNMIFVNTCNNRNFLIEINYLISRYFSKVKNLAIKIKLIITSPN